MYLNECRINTLLTCSPILKGYTPVRIAAREGEQMGRVYTLSSTRPDLASRASCGVAEAEDEEARECRGQLTSLTPTKGRSMYGVILMDLRNQLEI